MQFNCQNSSPKYDPLIILQLIYSEKVNALAYTKIFDSPFTGDPMYMEIKRLFVKKINMDY